MKHHLLLGAVVAAGLAAVYFMVQNVSAAGDVLTGGSLKHPELLVVATLFMTLAVIWYGVSWMLLLAQVKGGARPRWALMRFFLVTWPARYIPGTLPYHAARVLMAEKIGATRSAVMTSIAYELILSIGSSASMGAICVTIGLGMRHSAGSLYVIGMLPLLALPIVLQPRVLVPLANRALRMAGRQTLSAADVLSSKQTAFAFLSYCLVHVFNGIAFYCCIVALTDASVSPVLAIGAFSLAAAVGVAVIFVPSGIGVREAAIVAVMSSAMSAEQAVLVAATARALSVIADLSPLAVLGTWMLGGKARNLVRGDERKRLDATDEMLAEHRIAG